MSDMHIIDGTQDGHYRVVMHFAVPDVNNSAGLNLRTALVRSGNATATVLADGDGTGGTIDAIEKSALAAGALLEHVEPFVVETAGTTVAQIRAAVRAKYAQEESQIIGALQRRLKYFGRNEAKA